VVAIVVEKGIVSLGLKEREKKKYEVSLGDGTRRAHPDIAVHK
jgi:hypothetical protein